MSPGNSNRNNSVNINQKNGNILTDVDYCAIIEFLPFNDTGRNLKSRFSLEKNSHMSTAFQLKFRIRLIT